MTLPSSLLNNKDLENNAGVPNILKEFKLERSFSLHPGNDPDKLEPRRRRSSLKHMDSLFGEKAILREIFEETLNSVNIKPTPPQQKKKLKFNKRNISDVHKELESQREVCYKKILRFIYFLASKIN